MKRKVMALVLSFAMAAGLAGCGGSSTTATTAAATTAAAKTEAAATAAAKTEAAATAAATTAAAASSAEGKVLNIACWNDEFQSRVKDFYPGYKDNGDGTYTCTVNATAKIGRYTAETAPVVIPVNTMGYMAQNPPTDYDSSVESYCAEGMVYAFAGCRGRDAGAPTGVTDLKAAIRYTRYNKGVIPGNTDAIFSFGMSGGGAQSAVLGASGDSSLYDPYLTAIGAVTGVSDAVTGAMCWCPITNLDEADEAYEWNLGVTRTDLSTDEQALSDGLAEAYAKYINALGIKDENGNVLTLEESSDGIYQAGSYYDYLVGVVETSLNNFLADNTFPYTVQAGGMGMMGGMGGGKPDGAAAGMSLPDGMVPPDAAAGMSGAPAASGDAAPAAASGSTEVDASAVDNINRSGSSSTAAVTLSGTYNTVQDYIDALNEPFTWVTYDAAANTAKITSMKDFVTALKVASKGLGAFDELDKAQGENTLFGYGDGNGAHFDAVLASLEKGTDYEADFTADLSKKDSAGNTVDTRISMYTPLYYMCDYYDGYRTSNVAKYWRIRTGIDQSDTALSTEVNLALAAQNYSSDNQVDFATVWGLQHVMAERTGDSTTNFIAWVEDCTK